MKAKTTLVCMMLSLSIWAQDALELQFVENSTRLYYPVNVEFELYVQGVSIQLKSDSTFSSEDYDSLLVRVPWSEAPEVFTSTSGTFSLRKVAAEKKLEAPRAETSAKQKPSLLKKRIERRAVDSTYTLYARFSNGLEFWYDGQNATAQYGGEELNIEGHYLVDCPEGTLKLSFDPSSGAFWYVFDR